MWSGGPRTAPALPLRSGDQIACGALRIRGGLKIALLVRPKDRNQLWIGGIHLERAAERLTQKPRSIPRRSPRA